MKEAYCKAMDAIYWLCIWIAGLAMTVMVLVIPVQVAARKWFDSGLSWPSTNGEAPSWPRRGKKPTRPAE